MSALSASKCARLVSREKRLVGTHGSYVTDEADLQIRDLLAGRSLLDPGWGVEGRVVTL